MFCCNVDFSRFASTYAQKLLFQKVQRNFMSSRRFSWSYTQVAWISVRPDDICHPVRMTISTCDNGSPEER